MTKTYNTVGTGPKSNRIIVEGVKCCLYLEEDGFKKKYFRLRKMILNPHKRNGISHSLVMGTSHVNKIK